MNSIKNKSRATFQKECAFLSSMKKNETPTNLKAANNSIHINAYLLSTLDNAADIMVRTSKLPKVIVVLCILKKEINYRK